MAPPRIIGFFDKDPKVSLGLEGPASHQQHVGECELNLTTLSQEAPTWKNKLDEFSQCLSEKGHDTKSLYINYPLAKALFLERMQQEDIWKWWPMSSVMHVMPLAVAMRQLNMFGTDPFDGYFSYDLLKQGTSLYEETTKLIVQSVRKRKWLTRSKNQVVWLNLPPEELARFFYHSDGKKINQVGKAERKKLKHLRHRVYHLLKKIFDGYRVQFIFSEAKALKITHALQIDGKFIRVEINNKMPENDEENDDPMTIAKLFKDPRWRQQDFYEAVKSHFGGRSLGNSKTFSQWLTILDGNADIKTEFDVMQYWNMALKDPINLQRFSAINIYGSSSSIDLVSLSEPTDNYMGNQQYDEKINIFSKRLRVSTWHQNKLNLYKNEGLERLAQLIVYIVCHELMHTLGIPHLPRREGRDSLMMDGGESSDLSLLWKNPIRKLKNSEGTLVERLVRLLPYDQDYVDSQLKEKTDVSKREDVPEKMGCDFYIPLGSRCYLRYPVNNEEGGIFYDFQREENGAEAIGAGIIDEEDLYLAPDPKPLPVHNPLLEEKPDEKLSQLLGPQPTTILSFGHVFGQGPSMFHPLNLTRFFSSREYAIDATHVRNVAATLVTYDTRKIQIPSILYESEKPLTDKNPLVQKILDRLVEIVERSQKPIPTLKWPDGRKTVEDGWEERNRRKAIRLIQFYWQMGSKRAGDILSKIDLKNEGLKTLKRFDWIEKQLEKDEIKIGRLEK